MQNLVSLSLGFPHFAQIIRCSPSQLTVDHSTSPQMLGMSGRYRLLNFTVAIPSDMGDGMW
jgi:hypothetical protein